MAPFVRFLCHSVSAELRPRALLACVVASLLTVCSTTRPASACSPVFVQEYVGAPSDGDIDVPTDVVLSVSRSALGIYQQDTSGIEAVLTTESGDELAVALERPYAWWYTLTPKHPLEPNTLYTLTLTWSNAGLAEIRFTTGAGPLDVPPSPPSAALQHYRLVEPPRTTCSPHTAGTCIAVADNVWVHARSIDEFGQLHEPYLFRGPHLTNLSGIDQGTNVRCVELRSRALNGALSEAVTRCGDVAPLFDFNDEDLVECTAHGFPGIQLLDLRAVPPEETASTGPIGPGCIAAVAPGGERGFFWLLVALVALVAMRRPLGHAGETLH